MAKSSTVNWWSARVPRGREGVRHAWLVNPVVQTMEIFRLEGGVWRLVVTFRGHSKVRAEPFDAVELDLALLWAR
ncbi:MAG TPA: hypothetical protein VEY30_01865 [Myxococcaceae bacterium]|nr:hypothetical protein [Myxococcaceae bacterium]